MKGAPLVLASGALIMVVQAREKNEKVIPSLKELPLLGSVITQSMMKGKHIAGSAN
jgi:hypothetical protein